MPKLNSAFIFAILQPLICLCHTMLVTPPDGTNGINVPHPNRFSTVCVVSANMLYANGYFVRELTPDETHELEEYEVEIAEYNKLLHEHLTGAAKPTTKWIFGGRFILPFEQRTMPRRPSAPRFCTARDTVIHQLNGCIVQNYRVYIGSLYVRQLTDEEKVELDEYDVKVKEYQERIIDNMKRQLGTMISGVWYPYDRAIIKHRNILFGGIQEGSVKNETTTTTASTDSEESTTETSTTTQPTTTTTPMPLPPQAPKFCTQIF